MTPHEKVTLTIVAGLPGSGKSHWLESRCPTGGAAIGFSDVKYGPNDSEYQIPWVVKVLKSGNSCYVDDVSFCFENNSQQCEKNRCNFIEKVKREYEKEKEYEKRFTENILIKYVCFKIDIQNCFFNLIGDEVKGKGDWRSRHVAFVNHLASPYCFPNDTEEMEVVTKYDKVKSFYEKHLLTEENGVAEMKEILNSKEFPIKFLQDINKRNNLISSIDAFKNKAKEELNGIV